MITAAFVFVLSLLAIATRIAMHERRLRKHYETEAAQQRSQVKFYANAYAEARWPRTRSHVSEAREGFTTFTTVDELTAVKR
jgi:type II secretory pathway component PulK